ncbi:Phosphoribosylformylglycinamidine cyclo-ligase [hydrothermal vent metagenome]|uniref:phosphoribosylformylglycinamidine cyclo-ligase n=1 Tax=hydrothermal vent metagenome TaxID=652676 RepID=A0A3B0VQY8_9ZZZZ
MSDSDSTGLSYKDAGVDIDAGNQLVEKIKPAIKATTRTGVMGSIGGFGGLFDLSKLNYKNPVLVSGTDGVGTKLKLANMLNDHSSIGVDLVAMCVNDIIVMGAEPLFFLDYYACGQLNVDAATTVIRGIADGCEQSGCALIGGETAEMPGMYVKGDYDLAGFVVGAVEKDAIITGENINSDDVIIGIASSGPHSNGYSLIRKILEVNNTNLGEILAEKTIGEQLLQPTQIYVKPLLQLLDSAVEVNGIAHITGGGLMENISRVIPEGLGITIKVNSWDNLDIFNWLQQKGNLSSHEMLRTFNCGIGMVVITSKADSSDCQEFISNAGLQCWKIGTVRQSQVGKNDVEFI